MVESSQKNIDISSATAARFIDGLEILDKSLAKILDYYDYHVKIKIQGGPVLFKKYPQVIKEANEYIRKSGIAPPFEIARKTGINYAQAVGFIAGQDLTLKQLNKICKLKIEI